ncbi:MAG TPA: glycosyltransferase family 87 protein [Polyangiaceae bacterium]|nr:glycosyltransferase family 87 protein [Polyangiaceae bacterium]
MIAAPSRDRRIQEWITAVYRIAYTVAATVIGGHLFITGILKLIQFPWTSASRWDCGVDWSAAKLYFAQISPYSEEGLRQIGLEGYGFGHPPTTSFWFLPLANLPWPSAAHFICVVAEAALVALVAITVVELRIWAPVATTLLVAGLVLQTTWMDSHIAVVQISSVIACMYVVSWYFFRRGRDYWAGIPLGIACTIKLFPGVVVAYLLMMRRWRSVAAALTTYFIVFAVMTRRFGLSSWTAFFKQQGPISHFWIDYPRNASLYGIVLRLFRPSCERPNNDPFTGVRDFAKLPELPPMKGSGLAFVMALLIVAACGWLVLRTSKTRATLDLGFALFSVASAFVNPWIWEHYNVILISPMLVAFVYSWRLWSERYREWAAGAANLKTLIWAGVGFVSAALVIAAVMGALDVDMTNMQVIWEAKAANLPVSRADHRKMHLYEVVNWAPWPLVMGVLMSFLALFPRTPERIVSFPSTALFRLRKQKIS